MYKKGMRRAAALLAVCWLGLLFRAAAETPAEKLERLRAEQQAIEQQIEQNRTDAARAGDLVNLYTAKEQNVKAQIAVLQLKIQECEAQLAGTQAQVAAKLLEADRSTQSFEARMKGMYEMSRQSGLAVLLGADSLSEMLTFGEYLQRIAVRDTRLIAELTARREELAALAARQQAELDALDASNAELEAAANEYAAALQQANARLSAAQAAEQAGAAAFAAKEQEIAAAEREYAEWAAQSDNDAPEYTGGAFYWPLPGYSAGSPMGWRTLNGVQEFHRGMDIPAPLGTKIYAAADGVVSTKAHYTYGTCVKLSHGGGLVTIYAHMSAWAEGIADGVPVKQGQLIGYVGRTGRAYGYHLHFEANLNGAPVDVRDYLG